MLLRALCVVLLAAATLATSLAVNPIQSRLEEYARFGVILKLYRGSTNPYISSGKWRQHRTKQWKDVVKIIKNSPLHGAEIENGRYTTTRYNQMLQDFKQRTTRIIQYMNPSHRNIMWVTAKANSIGDYNRNIGLDGNIYTYDKIPVYDHDEMRDHWKKFRDYADKIDLTDRPTLTQYARYALVASLTRGLCDRFYKDAPKSPLVNKVFSNVPLARDIRANQSNYPSFTDINKCGNYMCHGLAKLDRSMDENLYAYIMLNLRKSLLGMVNTLTRFMPTVASDPKNAQVLAHWQAGLTQLNKISVATHGAELANFLSYGNAGQVQRQEQPGRLQAMHLELQESTPGGRCQTVVPRLLVAWPNEPTNSSRC